MSKTGTEKKCPATQKECPAGARKLCEFLRFDGTFNKFVQVSSRRCRAVRERR